jgi:hypothetical protein
MQLQIVASQSTECLVELCEQAVGPLFDINGAYPPVVQAYVVKQPSGDHGVPRFSRAINVPFACAGEQPLCPATPVRRASA